jgi:hypothetical protein
MCVKMRRTSFFIDLPLVKGLKALKTRDGIPEAEAIRRAVAQFLESQGVVPARSRKVLRLSARTR